MVVSHYNIDGKSVACPVDYSQVATKLYCDMQRKWEADWIVDDMLTPKGMIGIFAALTGSQYKDYAFSEDSNLEMTLMKAIRFVLKTKLDIIECPEFFVFNKKYVAIPKKFSRLALQQNLMIKQKLTEDWKQHIPYILAVYMEPLLCGKKFDEDSEDNIESLMLEIDEMPITTTYPIARFFIQRHLSYGRKLSNLWQQILRTIQMPLNVLRLLNKQKSISLMSLILLLMPLNMQSCSLASIPIASYSKDLKTLFMF